MSTVRRYTADEIAYRSIRKDVPRDIREMLTQAWNTEVRVIEVLEKIEIAASQGATQIVRDLAREALSKFRGEDA